VIEVNPDTGAIRLDDDGLADLLDVGSDGRDPAMMARLAEAGLHPALKTLADPVVTLELVVAGTSVLRHSVRVDLERAVVVLGVRPGLHHVLVMPPAHLAAGLVRMTHMRPRRTGERLERPYPADQLDTLVAADVGARAAALERAGADFAWHLGVSSPGGDRHEVTAINGPDGLFLANPMNDALRPVSNTTAYRIFSTVLQAQPLELTH